LPEIVDDFLGVALPPARFGAPDAKRKAIDYACERFGSNTGEVHVYEAPARSPSVRSLPTASRRGSERVRPWAGV